MGLIGKHGIFREQTLNEIEWRCDNCDETLNTQNGFNTSSGVWICTNCGHENIIDADEILSEEEANNRYNYEEEVNTLISEMETMNEYEYERRLEALPIEYQRQVKEAEKEFADDAIGDKSWRNRIDFEDE